MTIEAARPQHDPKGRVITFYSYKGGTGRSMAVANIAWILAMSGERVLVVDWDLEAPGIHRYFHPFLQDKELSSTNGLLDLVDTLQTRAIANPNMGPDDVDAVEYVKILEWPAECAVQWEHFGPFARIDLLGAGRQDAAYSSKLNTFNWIDFYQRLGGGRLLKMAREQLRAVYDYILIDSRTGVSDTSGICTVDMPDTLVVCFTLNDQSITGASGVAESVQGQHARRADAAGANPSGANGAPAAKLPFRVFPVPTRVEIGSERDKREAALELAQRRFAPFLNHLPHHDSPSKYWGRVQLAYFAFYAFEEIPAIFGDRPDDQLSLTTGLKRIAEALSNTNSLSLTPLAAKDEEAEKLRKQILGWYLRRPYASAADPVHLANRIFDELDTANRGVMRSILLRLVQIVPGAAPAPATVPEADFDGPLREMVQKLVAAGVLQVSDGAVSVADRSIVEEWDLLRQWVKANEPFLIWRQNFAGSVRLWQRTGSDPSALLRGKVLADAQGWQIRYPQEFNAVERDFLAASGRESRPAPVTSATLPNKTGFWSLSRVQLQLLTMAGLLIGVFGWFYRGCPARSKAELNLRGPAIIKFASDNYKVDPLKPSLLLAELPDYPATQPDRDIALQVALSNIPDFVVQGKTPYHSLEIAQDGKSFVAATDGGVEILAANTWEQSGSVASGPVVSASFNGWNPEKAKKKGKSGQIDKVVTVNSAGVVAVWSLDGKQAWQFPADAQGAAFSTCSKRLVAKSPSFAKAGKLEKPVYARFSPDEAVVVLEYATGTLVMVDARDGTCLDTFVNEPVPAPLSVPVPSIPLPYPAVPPVAFSPDGEWAAIPMLKDGSLVLLGIQNWDEHHCSAASLGSNSFPVAVSFNSLVLPQVLLSTSLVDPAKCSALPNLYSLLGSGSFSWSGRSAIIGATWLPVIGEPTAESLIGQSQINEGAFDKTGAWILTASADKTIRVWSTARQKPSQVATWPELIANLKAATHVCLTAADREKDLGESKDIAEPTAAGCQAASLAARKAGR